MCHQLFARHEDTLNRAMEHIRSRTSWSPYPEIPAGKHYGETAKTEGLAAFQGRLNHTFDLGQPGPDESLGEEVSPYGIQLGVKYPRPDIDALIKSAEQAILRWRAASVESRIGVCLEILQELNRHSFEMAYAVMHTTGQSFLMAFQAGGPHAQDRGLEAVAYAYCLMTFCNHHTIWQKQVTKTESVSLSKRYIVVPRGIAVAVGCSTFPTWNTYPGVFASLATGNAVIVKPHPRAVLPLAITVEIARRVLHDAGFDSNLVLLAADISSHPITKPLVTRREVKVVDYTGSSSFGDWICANAKGATVYAEKGGVNAVILHSADNLKAVAANIAMSVCLYSGQMCSTPHIVFVPEQGIQAGGESVGSNEVARAIVDAIDDLLKDGRRACEILGAIQSEEAYNSIDGVMMQASNVLRRSERVENEQFPLARTRSPLVIGVKAKETSLYLRELFGPVCYIVFTKETTESIELAARSAQKLGGIVWSVYSKDEAVISNATASAIASGASIAINLTGSVYVNQASAFSDFHVSRCNPSGNATLCDAHFVSGRFSWAQTRRLVIGQEKGTERIDSQIGVMR